MQPLTSNSERRSRARLAEVLPISVRQAADSLNIPGRVFNHSATGIYFETNTPLDPGSEVYIGMGLRAAGAAADFCCRAALIVWCRELSEDAQYPYGCGASFVATHSAPASAPAIDKRRHPRRPFRKPVQLVDGTEFFKAVAEDISASGILVKSGKQPTPGQTVTLGLPDRTGRTVAVRAKVVWSNAAGFGLKFIS